MIPFQPRLYRTDLHYQGEWLGIRYIAFTKTPLVHSCSLVSLVVQTQYTSPRWVTHKTKSNEPLHPPWQSEHYAPTPIDGPTAKPTTPLGSSNYSAKVVPFHPYGCTVILGGHSTNRSLRRGTQVSHPGFRGTKLGREIITRCAGTKSHTYNESWHRIECHIFTI
jgi:hypothetical protein